MNLSYDNLNLDGQKKVYLFLDRLQTENNLTDRLKIDMNLKY